MKIKQIMTIFHGENMRRPLNEKKLKLQKLVDLIFP